MAAVSAESLSERMISLGCGLPLVPERLLLAHARGQVLFIAGAGISMPAGLPDFRRLVVGVYEVLDPAIHAFLVADVHDDGDISGFTYAQQAEVRRFRSKEYDVVLGMLERRVDGISIAHRRFRTTVSNLLKKCATKPAPIHRALMQLADRGGSSTIITTNFDRLLQGVSDASTYSLGGIPRPSRGADFSGVLHIHGVLRAGDESSPDVILTDQDFGEFYLRRRVIGDLIYDAARLYHIVLVGYSANDPPMKYLLNSIAADGVRFDDLRERFSFVAQKSNDPVEIEDWKGRGITPIVYDEADDHSALLSLLQRWAELSAISGKDASIKRIFKRVTKAARADSSDSDRDLVDHIFRRGSDAERVRFAQIACEAGSDLSWLDAMISISKEPRNEVKHV